MSHVDGTNRAVLALLGLLLLAGGLLGLLLSLGVLAPGQAGSPVVPDAVRTFAAQTPWFWWAVAAACLILALLGLRWLLAQLHSDRVGRLDLTDNVRDGLTTVHAGAVTSAVEAEAQTIRGIADASAQLRGEQGHRLDLAVDLTDYADIADVRNQLQERLVPHVRQALDDPELPVAIELRPDRTGRGRSLR